jgi:hypothetical protein
MKERDRKKEKKHYPILFYPFDHTIESLKTIVLSIIEKYIWPDRESTPPTFVKEFHKADLQ